MTHLDELRAWAPDYPWTFSAVQARDALGVPVSKINAMLNKLVKYGIVEKVGIFEGVSYWRWDRPEGAEERPPAFHTAPVRSKPQRPPSASTARLRAWVEALPPGTRFMTADAFDATGVSNACEKLHRFDDLIEIIDRNGRIQGRIMWRRI